MKSVLMVAFHFPPQAGSSGVQRTLRFAQHLPRFGWRPLILTAHAMAHERTDNGLLSSVPPEAVVERALAFDAARHFSILGRYPGWLARPDRWASWRFDALRRAMRLIRHHRPQLIWSSYPISTAHVIAAQLVRQAGLPWVADFRDPMAQPGYPADPKTWAQWARIEHQTLQQADAAVFVAPGARRYYAERYPDLDADRWQVIENGFEEASFPPSAPHRPLDAGRLTLLHSGLIYPSERDPQPLFDALSRLPPAALPPFALRLRAPGDEGWLKELINRYGIGDRVHTAPAIPYRDALAEMQAADALVVMQAANCNQQIPAKVYEYLRARRPLFGLVDPAGDTADWLRHVHEGRPVFLADPANPDAIAGALLRLLPALLAGRVQMPPESAVLPASRLERTRQLAGLFDHIAGPSNKIFHHAQHPDSP